MYGFLIIFMVVALLILGIVHFSRKQASSLSFLINALLLIVLFVAMGLASAFLLSLNDVDFTSAIAHFLDKPTPAEARPLTEAELSVTALTHMDANDYLGNQINLLTLAMTVFGFAFGLLGFLGWQNIKQDSEEMAEKVAKEKATQAVQVLFEEFKARYSQDYLNPLLEEIQKKFGESSDVPKKKKTKEVEYPSLINQPDETV